MALHFARLALADHQVLFRQALHALLVERGWLVVAATDTGENLVSVLADSQATVLIIDRALPGISVLDFCSIQTAIDPELRILILTGYEPEAYAMQLPALWAGAAGCLSKDHAGDVYINALEVITRDLTLFSRTTLRTALQESRHASNATRPSPPTTKRLPPPFQEITPRELEILALIADGRSNPEIAERLSITDHTVMKHVSHIIQKLKVRNRMEAGLLYLKMSNE